MRCKKAIHSLREELLAASGQFQRFFIYDDHIVCVFANTSKFMSYVPQHKNRLKQYIQHNFQDVLAVDVFSDYFVVWHNTVAVSQEHQNRLHINRL